MNAQQNLIKIILEVIRTPEIPQRRRKRRPLALERLAEAEFRHRDIRHRREELRRDVLEELADARGRAVQPVHRRVRCRADGEADGGDGSRACALWESGVRSVRRAGFDAAGDGVRGVGCVRVDGEEVAGSLDEIFFLLREFGEEVAEGVLERLGVVSVRPWAAEPAEDEVVVALASFFVLGLCAVGLEVVTGVFECDSSTALEIFMVPFGYLRVGQQRVMSAEESRLVPACHAVGSRIVLSRRVERVLPVAVLWLVDGEPLVNVGVITLDDEFGVVEEVVDDPAVGPGTILGEQCEGCVPMEEGHRRYQSIGMHFRNNIVIMLDSLFVDGPVTKGKEARPGEARAECYKYLVSFPILKRGKGYGQGIHGIPSCLSLAKSCL